MATVISWRRVLRHASWTKPLRELINWFSFDARFPLFSEPFSSVRRTVVERFCWNSLLASSFMVCTDICTFVYLYHPCGLGITGTPSAVLLNCSLLKWTWNLKQAHKQERILKSKWPSTTDTCRKITWRGLISIRYRPNTHIESLFLARLVFGRQSTLTSSLIDQWWQPGLTLG